MGRVAEEPKSDIRVRVVCGLVLSPRAGPQRRLMNKAATMITTNSARHHKSSLEARYGHRLLYRNRTL